MLLVFVALLSYFNVCKRKRGGEFNVSLATQVDTENEMFDHDAHNHHATEMGTLYPRNHRLSHIN